MREVESADIDDPDDHSLAVAVGVCHRRNVPWPRSSDGTMGRGQIELERLRRVEKHDTGLGSEIVEQRDRHRRRDQVATHDDVCSKVWLVLRVGSDEFGDAIHCVVEVHRTSIVVELDHDVDVRVVRERLLAELRPSRQLPDRRDEALGPRGPVGVCRLLEHLLVHRRARDLIRQRGACDRASAIRTCRVDLPIAIANHPQARMQPASFAACIRCSIS
jgi:hypothetical protein